MLPLTLEVPRNRQSESDSIPVGASPSLSLLNFNHWWFCFRTCAETCFHVLYIQHATLKGLKQVLKTLHNLFKLFLNDLNNRIPKLVISINEKAKLKL